MGKIVDVSEHQGLIDFAKLKSNVSGVIIRAGYGSNNIDKQWVRNITECNRLGIPAGAYWFSYAYSVTTAFNEARYLLEAVKPYKLELPLAFDYEYDSVTYGQNRGVSITSALVRSMASAFCQKIKDEKYYCLLYANPDFINRYFGDLAQKYDLWLAEWPNVVDVSKPPRSCGIWQWGASKVPGVTGNVDSNESYKDYVSIIKSSKLNHLTSTPTVPSIINSVVSSQHHSHTSNTSTAHWYDTCMNWAKQNNINDGTRPSAFASRAEVSQMLYNYYNKFRK